MTWARNYSDRSQAGILETGKRAKKTRPCKLLCGAHVLPPKLYCGPCRADACEAAIKARRHRYVGRKYGKAKVNAIPELDR